MAIEMLSVPEESLREVILVIRYGIRDVAYLGSLSQRTMEFLETWCNEEEQYLDENGFA